MTPFVCTGDKACGKTIRPGEEYRCMDCDAVMHRDCLRWHCSADEKDRLIYRLQGTIRELNGHLTRLCADPPPAAPTRGAAGSSDDTGERT